MLMDLIALIDLIAATGLYLAIFFTVYVDINKVPKQNNLNHACFPWSRPDTLQNLSKEQYLSKYFKQQ